MSTAPIPSPLPSDFERNLAADCRTCMAATPGPWVEHTAPPADTRQVYSASKEHDCIYSGEWVASFATEEDAAFTIAARTGWPATIRLLVEARQEIAALRAEVERLKVLATVADY